MTGNRDDAATLSHTVHIVGAAASRALELDRNECRAYAESFSWERSTAQFLDNLVPARRESGN